MRTVVQFKATLNFLSLKFNLTIHVRLDDFSENDPVNLVNRVMGTRSTSLTLQGGDSSNSPQAIRADPLPERVKWP